MSKSTPQPPGSLDIEGLRRLMHIHEGPEASRDTARNYHYALSRAAPALLDAVEERDRLREEVKALNEPDGARVVALGGEMLTGSEIYARMLDECKLRHRLVADLEAERAAHARTREALNRLRAALREAQRTMTMAQELVDPKRQPLYAKFNLEFGAARAAQALLEGERDAR